MSDISDLLAPLISAAGDPVPVEELQRRAGRRRLRIRAGIAAVTAGVVIAAAVTAVTLSGGSPGYVSVPGAPASRTVALPPDQLVQDISVVDGGLVLGGQSAPDPQSCVAIPVDPATLAFGPARRADCDNPSLSGHRVGAVVSQGSSGRYDSTLRVTIADPAEGKVSPGAVLFAYEDGSDTRPLWAYGGGHLWVYDVDTADGPEVVQVSATTGRVEATIPMPELYRPILAADDDGLWIGDSIEGTGAGVDTLYRVGPGARRALPVIPGTGVVRWLVADGHHVWVGTSPAGALTQEIWRFDGATQSPVFRVAETGFDPTDVIGDESSGLWTMQWQPPFTTGIPQGSRAQVLVRIDPDTGTEQTVATLPAVPVPPGEGAYGLAEGQAAVFDGVLYLLEPPFRANGYQGYSALVRVPVSGNL